MTPSRGNDNVLPVALILVSLFALTSAQTASAQNTHFFPEHGAAQNTKYCDVPRYQTPLAPEAFDNRCLVRAATLNDDEIEWLAQAYAPYLFFHPLEPYTMSSINHTFNNPKRGQIYMHNYLFDNDLHQESLLASTRDNNYVIHGDHFHIEHELSQNYMEGDGFDREGLSKAQIYYNFFVSEDNTITFNYYLWFPLSGPASLGLITSVNGTNQYIPFQQPPYGTKEGDWESLSVRTCATQLENPTQQQEGQEEGVENVTQAQDNTTEDQIPQIPLTVTYRPREGESALVLDCTKGQCTFFRDSTTHPVGFVALGSHEIYPSSVNEMVYSEVPKLDFLVNLQAVLVVHRTAYADGDGGYRYFAPNAKPSNVLRLPNQNDVPEKVDESDYWVSFGGRFGRIDELDVSIVGNLPTCLDNETATSTVGCPTETENRVFTFLMQMLKVYPPKSSFIEASSIVYEYLLSRYTAVAKGPFGPAASPHYERLSNPKNAPIWEHLEARNLSTGDEFCRYLVDRIPDTVRFPIDVEPIPLLKHAAFVTVMILSFVAFNIFLVLVLRRRFLREPVLQVDNSGNYKAPTRAKKRGIFSYALCFTIAYAFAVAAAAVFTVGYTLMSDIPLVGDTDRLGLEAIDIFTFVFGILGFISDTCLLVLTWLVASETWLAVQRKYHLLVDDIDAVGRHQWDNFHTRYWRIGRATFKISLPRQSRGLHAVMFSLTFVSFFISVVMVATAVYRVGAAYVFGHACRASVGSFTGICLKLPWYEEIYCGRQFQEFCLQWSEQRMLLQLWGGFALVISHYYLLTFASMSAFAAQHIQRTLDLYPDKAPAKRITANERMDEQVHET